MDSGILCTLLNNAGLAGKARVDGQEVIFYDKDLGVNKPSSSPNTSEYDTPENRAIVDDVIANYETLASEYEESQKVIRKRQAYKLEADPLYIEWQILLAVNHPDAATRHQEWLDKRSEIDLRFIKET